MKSIIVFDDEYFMRQALEEAQKAFEEDEVPVGCVLVCDNKIIARFHNLAQTLKDFTAHAEMQAISSASLALGDKYLSDCTLYVTLEPCVMCCGACFWSQLGKLIYGCQDENRGGISKGLLHSKTKVISGILEKECSQILKDFFSIKRKQER